MRARGVIIVALCLLATIAPGPAVVAQDDGLADDRAAIQELLDRRAAAFMARDRAGFMATIDPSAGAFARRQARMWRFSEAVPFESYRYYVDWARFGDLVRPSDARRYSGAGSVSIPLTQERYRLKGFDEVEAVEDVYFTFVARDGAWLIAADDDLDDIGLLSVRHPWDLGPLIATRSEHFLGLGPPCANDGGPCADQDLLARAEEALDRLDSTWTASWNDQVILVVPPSGDALARMLQASFDPNDFVAFAYSTVDPVDLSYTGDRIIVNPAVIAGRPPADVLRILAHELLHVATRDVAGAFIPLFVDEGLAEYVGYGGAPGLAYFDAIVAGGSFDEKLPEDFEFSTGSTGDIYLSYQESQSAVAYFIDRWGMARFTKFYRRLGRARLTPGLATWHTDRALKRTIDMGLAGFEKAWASSIGA
jgi:hypothetical protein